jgi:Acetyltransferases, including N-acetylases of ribosomal proteins
MQKTQHNQTVAGGLVSFLRITPEHGVIEVGHIHYANRLQKTPAATEAMYLMMNYVFEELGYRRYEWKCNALNAPSKQSAERLGFTYEGTFRQALISKGLNRDSAWFSILDSEWPKQKNAFEAWLDQSNFSGNGTQKQNLAFFKRNFVEESHE